MPAKLVDGQPVGPATPRKRTPKPPSEPSAPHETTLESVQDEVGELRASIEVMNEDLLQKLADFGKAMALVREGDDKAARGTNAQLLETLTKLSERVALQADRSDALLAALAICDRLPSKRFDQLLSEFRALARKREPEPSAKSDVKPPPVWLVWSLWIAGTVIVCLAMVGAYALVR